MIVRLENPRIVGLEAADASSPYKPQANGDTRVICKILHPLLLVQQAVPRSQVTSVGEELTAETQCLQ